MGGNAVDFQRIGASRGCTGTREMKDPHRVQDGGSSMSTHICALCWIVQAHV